MMTTHPHHAVIELLGVGAVLYRQHTAVSSATDGLVAALK